MFSGHILLTRKENPVKKIGECFYQKKNFLKKLSSLGIDKNKTIVAYAENKSGWGEDGRIIWMLRMLGIENSKMLNGGFDYWKNKNLEISKDDVTPKKK